MQRICLTIALFTLIAVTASALGGPNGGGGPKGGGPNGNPNKGPGGGSNKNGGGKAGNGGWNGNKGGWNGNKGGRGFYWHGRLLLLDYADTADLPFTDRSGQDIPVDGVSSSDAQEWGMRVTDVMPKGPAARANLRVGDIIVMADGKRTQSFDDLTAALAGTSNPIVLVFINGESNKLEKLKIEPVSGKIGVATDSVVLQ